MPRLYLHLLTDHCEAPGCRVRTCSFHRLPGGYVKACTPAHALLADQQLAQRGTTARRREGR